MEDSSLEVQGTPTPSDFLYTLAEALVDEQVDFDRVVLMRVNERECAVRVVHPNGVDYDGHYVSL